ncbi:MAG: 50S ribosomal protein L25/general stress protein Ctc [bacterium]
MAHKIEVVAAVREDQGKGASRRLRRTGNVPAVVYGAGQEAQAISVENRAIVKHLDNEAFYSSILTLNIGDASEKVVLRDVQRHPAKESILHLDFLRVDPNEKIHVHVPVHVINAEKSEGVKHGANVQRLISDVEVICLPSDIPEYLEADIEHLGVGESLHLSDLPMPDNCVLAALALGDDHNQAIVNLKKGRGA